MCIFVNISYVSYLFTNFTVYSSSSGFVFVHIYNDDDVNYLQNNNKVSSKDLWLYFSVWHIFFKVWFNKSANIKLGLFVFLIVYLLLFLHKNIKTPDYQVAMRSCNR